MGGPLPAPPLGFLPGSHTTNFHLGLARMGSTTSVRLLYVCACTAGDQGIFCRGSGGGAAVAGVALTRPISPGGTGPRPCRPKNGPTNLAAIAGGREGYGFEYAVTNIEYTEFQRLGIQDEAQAGGSRLSVFPANTNVLYVNLKVRLLDLPHS